MWVPADDFKLRIGGNCIQCTPVVIAFRGKPLLTVVRRESDGQLGIELDLHNQNGDKVAVVRGHRILCANQSAGDVEAEGYRIEHGPEFQRITEDKTGEVLCETIRRPGDGGDGQPVELDVRLHLFLPGRGELLRATPDEIWVGTSRIWGNIVIDSAVAIELQ